LDVAPRSVIVSTKCAAQACARRQLGNRHEQIPISRGFRGAGGNRRSDRLAGPALDQRFPVLSAGLTPQPNLAAWSFSLHDGDFGAAE
jgi:hypothetical protein